MSGLVPLSPDRLADAADALALAFRDNPLNVAVIGDDAERRLRSNRAGMRQLLPAALRHGWVLTAPGAGRVDGALIAAPPFRHPLPAPPLALQLRTLWVQGLRTQRLWGRVFEHLQPLHPLEPHWYLSTLGVRPEARGRGLGRELLRAFLARADAEGRPSYLETDRAANLSLYEPAGFAVERESEVLGVRIWHLRRPAPAS